MIDALVTVVMPCYRMGDFVREALASVGTQTYRRWELIVVDDCGPDDGTREAVEDFARIHCEKRIEYIRHDTNAGVSAARNTGIDAGKGEFVALLDPDDIWFPDHLQKALRVFSRAGAEVAVVSSPVEVFWDDGRPPKRWPIDRWRLEYFPASLAAQNFIQPSAAVLRRSALLAIGGFSTNPALQFIEDYDCWIRLVEQGYSFEFHSDVTSRYRKHAAAATSDLAKGRERFDALCRCHTGFFVRMQAELIARSHQEMFSLKHALRNPLRWLSSGGTRHLLARAARQRDAA